MKKIAYILTAALAFGTLVTSCDDMLEEKNYGNQTTADMMSNEQNVVLLVGQIYADLKYTHDHWGYWGLQTITADEGICVPRNSGADWNDGGYWMKQNTHEWNHRGDAIENVWNITISNAVLCNKIINTLQTYKENMSEDVYKAYLGEAEVLRCYYFYQLFDCFGRIPYTEKFEEVTGALLEPEEVWSNLVAVLERNAPNMSVVNDGTRAALYGRTTQGFAYALLARLYINAESYGCTPDNIFKTVEKPQAYSGSFYDNCIRCCDNVIKSGAYAIESNYFANFKIKNENSRENIFVIVEDGREEGERSTTGAHTCMNKLRIAHNTMHYGVQFAYDMPLDTWNGFCARPEFLELYKGNDVRGVGYEKDGTHNKKEWGWFVGPVYKKGSNDYYIDTKQIDDDHPSGTPTVIVSDIKNIKNASNMEGARLNKWELDKSGDGIYKYEENDFPIMRYADVLWMKEEAIKRGGAGTSEMGSADFQKLLARSFAYDNGAETFKAEYGDPASWTLKDILDERGREFTWEMVRRRDLIRFGEFGNIQYVRDCPNASARAEIRKWFPIPFSVLQKSLRDENGNPIWTQTPGYENL